MLALQVATKSPRSGSRARNLGSQERARKTKTNKQKNTPKTFFRASLFFPVPIYPPAPSLFRENDASPHHPPTTVCQLGRTCTSSRCLLTMRKSGGRERKQNLARVSFCFPTQSGPRGQFNFLLPDRRLKGHRGRRKVELDTVQAICRRLGRPPLGEVGADLDKRAKRKTKFPRSERGCCKSRSFPCSCGGLGGGNRGAGGAGSVRFL